MAETNQRIEIVAGDDKAVRVTVRDINGNLVNLDDADEITWVMARKPGDTPLISKTKTGGGITVLGLGVMGVQPVPADTIGLSGSYEHQARVELAGKKTTVMLGYVFVTPSLIPAA